MREYCLKCLKSVKSCLCFYAVELQTKTHFCFLMHPKEAKKEKVGTGRMTHLSLPNSSLIIDYNFDRNKDFLKLLEDSRYQHFLLYPGEKAINLSFEKPQIDSSKIPLIFILDGTWSCAKSMMRDTHLLHSLPRVSFSSDHQSAFAIKQQPASYCLSTIESVAIVLENLKNLKIEDETLATETLHFQLLKLVHEQIKAANDELRPSYRKRAKKPYEFAVKKEYKNITDGVRRRNICYV
jgi:DTW domain-containing protein YfiP